MDLEAYAQIEDLGKLAKDNNIVVPRLRGYRLMQNEKPISTEEIKRIMNSSEIDVCSDLCRAEPFWNANAACYGYSSHTDSLCNYYLDGKVIANSVETYGYKKYEYTGIRWDRIHGWKRKVLKFAIKNQKRRIQQQCDMWNKYAGKSNVLYIHARIGGLNWKYYDCNEIAKSPWFLDKVDDWFDNTYCDIYASVNNT